MKYFLFDLLFLSTQKSKSLLELVTSSELVTSLESKTRLIQHTGKFITKTCL